MKKMIKKDTKVLFVVDSLGSGGAGRVVAILAEQLAKEYSVYLADFTTDRDCYVTSKNLKIFHLRKDASSNNLSFLKKCNLIREVALQNQINIVISFGADMNIYTSVASLFAPWKLIISIRNNPYTSPTNRKLRIMRFLLYRFADGFTFQTEDEKLYFSKRIQSRGTVIENPVNANIPEPYDGVRDKRVVMVGRLNKQKNYPMAIEAFRIVHQYFPDYKLEIYGDGELKNELNILIAQNGLCDCVSMMGHVDNVWEKTRCAGLYIMTSDYEGMSNALIEAMAMGIPSISTDHPIGGARQLIIDKYNGLLSDVGNIKMFANKMLYLIENPEFAEDISKRSSEIRVRLSAKKIADRWREYINNILMK